MDYRGRQANLRGVLADNRLDGLLVSHIPNIRYLCGFTGSTAVLLVTEREAVLFTDGRYTSQARSEVQRARVSITHKPALLAAGDWLKSHDRSLSLGVEAERLTVAAFGRLKERIGPGFRLRQAPPLVDRARMVKEPEELTRIREAVALGSALFPKLLRVIRPGVAELAVAAQLEYAARKAGATSMAFDTIIAAGKRSSLPHGRASGHLLPRAGFVVCDFGVILGGYCSDMTRTVHVGSPTREARHVYQAVREAQQAAIEAVRPGQSVGEVDRAARKLLQKEKLARYFTHSTGHGVGLEVHEAPRLAAKQEEILRPGMVVTIEPGVYIPGKFGVRIEDMVVVSERGCEVLTPTSKELIAI